MSSWDAGVHFGLGYEFSFGLFIQTRGGLNFINSFAKDTETDNNGIFDKATVTGLTKAKNHYSTLSLGYNLATLFTE